MIVTHKARCREFRGPTPHSVAVVYYVTLCVLYLFVCMEIPGMFHSIVLKWSNSMKISKLGRISEKAFLLKRAKFPSLKPPDYLTLERKKQETERENFAEFTKYQRSWDIKNSWIKSSDRNYVRNTTERQVKAAINQYELSIEERRARLRIMLETEEQQLLKETEERRETALERQTKMRARAKVLRDIRETKRQQMVSEKMEQLFINQCEELRTVLSKRREEKARLDCMALVRSKQEQQQEEQMKGRQFAEMWETICQREEKKESERIERQQQKSNEYLTHLRAQIDAAEQQKQQAKELKEEEAAQLLRKHKEMLMLQEQREKHQRLKAQQTRRRQLDQSYRMKMKRLAKEQQEELALDMSILQQVLSQDRDEKQEAVQRKMELHEEQQRYRQFLADELEKQKQLEQETEKLIEEKLRETWAKREKQSEMERDARNRLMKDVLEARSLQIQHKLELNKLKQDQLARDKEELTQMTEEIKLLDLEEKRRHKELCRAYQADLQAQMQHKQQLRRNEKALEEREVQYGLAVQQEYDRMKEKILSRPSSHTTVAHPFRRTEGAKSASSHRCQRE